MNQDVPHDLPEWANFSEPFERNGLPHILWGGPGRGHTTVRRFSADDSHTDLAYLSKTDDGLWAIWYVGEGRDLAAKSDDWQELIRLYT